ncbi:MAG: DNA photolyase [Rhodobacteraceae bacterium]|nr:DNA photolyase [Paracoccaceae bacterium]NNK67547.1 DNA photolyase [Paracoccaceae bacterium]
MTLSLSFPPTRTEALTRLADFVPRAGRDYASQRNYDRPGHRDVSTLSPYLRHRLITETEVLQSVLGRHSPAAAEKFVQEVFWRTYWKGWLEMRPQVWRDYQHGLTAALNRVQTEAGLRAAWESACLGDTGLDAFDHWARELASTGYLHNHARMWFASIWIFTLRLPWELGADFFLRHLLDGDPASNTLSWRWVAGLQTQGKHYLARPANISKYTEWRFGKGLALDVSAAPLSGPPHPPRQALPETQRPDPDRRTGFLLTEEDLSPGHALTGITVATSCVLLGTAGRSPLTVAPAVADFTRAATEDCLNRFADRLGTPAGLFETPEDVADWARAHDLEQIVMPHAPVGPAADRAARAARLLADDGIPVLRVIRPYDSLCWPRATAGFFKFKAHIPAFLKEIAGSKAA